MAEATTDFSGRPDSDSLLARAESGDRSVEREFKRLARSGDGDSDTYASGVLAMLALGRVTRATQLANRIDTRASDRSALAFAAVAVASGERSQAASLVSRLSGSINESHDVRMLAAGQALLEGRAEQAEALLTTVDMASVRPGISNATAFAIDRHVRSVGVIPTWLYVVATALGGPILPAILWAIALAMSAGLKRSLAGTTAALFTSKRPRYDDRGWGVPNWVIGAGLYSVLLVVVIALQVFAG